MRILNKMAIKERSGIGYSPLSSEGNKLRLALESDKIRPLWSSYSESVDLPKKQPRKY